MLFLLKLKGHCEVLIMVVNLNRPEQRVIGWFGTEGIEPPFVYVLWLYY